jgi:hypothetical protein
VLRLPQPPRRLSPDRVRRSALSIRRAISASVSSGRHVAFVLQQRVEGQVGVGEQGYELPRGTAWRVLRARVDRCIRRGSGATSQAAAHAMQHRSGVPWRKDDELPRTTVDSSSSTTSIEAAAGLHALLCTRERDRGECVRVSRTRAPALPRQRRDGTNDARATGTCRRRGAFKRSSSRAAFEGVSLRCCLVPNNGQEPVQTFDDAKPKSSKICS